MMRILVLAILTSVASIEAHASRKPKADGVPPTQPAAAARLSDFDLGKPVLGKGSLSDAKGKGVVIEAWGVNCPPCIASLPHLQELSVKHKDKVLFFGAECQMSDKKSISAVIQKAGVTYPIFSGLDKCPIQFSGIPHAFVFDATGKMIFDGSPYDPQFSSAITKAAGTANGGPSTTAAPVSSTKATKA